MEKEDSNLESKVIEDIEKSGFGSELRALKILKEAKWNASGLTSYVDLDESITRESDIVAYSTSLAFSKNKIESQIFISLAIEVKKSSKPWIILKEKPNFELYLDESTDAVIFCDGLGKKKSYGPISALDQEGLGRKLGWIGKGVHESFKNPDQPSRWYSSFISACKMAEHDLKQNSWPIKNEDPPINFPFVHYVKPIIVLDGKLFSAEIEENNEVKIEPIKMCSVKFHFSTKEYKRGQYIVDVVQIDALKEYLEYSKEKLEIAHNELREMAGLPKEYQKGSDQ